MDSKLVELNSINIGVNASNLICMQMLLESDQVPQKLKRKVEVLLERTKIIQENLREQEDLLS